MCTSRDIWENNLNLLSQWTVQRRCFEGLHILVQIVFHMVCYRPVQQPPLHPEVPYNFLKSIYSYEFHKYHDSKGSVHFMKSLIHRAQRFTFAEPSPRNLAIYERKKRNLIVIQTSHTFKYEIIRRKNVGGIALR